MTRLDQQYAVYNQRSGAKCSAFWVPASSWETLLTLLALQSVEGPNLPTLIHLHRCSRIILYIHSWRENPTNHQLLSLWPRFFPPTIKLYQTGGWVQHQPHLFRTNVGKTMPSTIPSPFLYSRWYVDHSQMGGLKFKMTLFYPHDLC